MADSDPFTLPRLTKHNGRKWLSALYDIADAKGLEGQVMMPDEIATAGKDPWVAKTVADIPHASPMSIAQNDANIQRRPSLLNAEAKQQQRDIVKLKRAVYDSLDAHSQDATVDDADGLRNVDTITMVSYVKTPLHQKLNMPSLLLL